MMEVSPVRRFVPVLAAAALAASLLAPGPAGAQTGRGHLGVPVQEHVSLVWDTTTCAFRRVFSNGSRSPGSWAVPFLRQLVVTDYGFLYGAATPNQGDSMRVVVNAFDIPGVGGLQPLREALVPLDRHGDGSLLVNDTAGTVLASGARLTLDNADESCGEGDHVGVRCNGCWIRGYLVRLPLRFIPPGEIGGP